MNIATTNTYFLLVASTREINGKIYAGSWFTERFTSIEDAQKYHLENNTNRNKGDEYDKHYNELPFIIEQYIETRLLIQ